MESVTILKEAQVLLEGHFLLSSGRHSAKYCQCAKLFEQPALAKQVVAEVAKKLADVEYDLIVGPAMGGVIAAYELSAQTGKRNIFVERVDGIMTMKRGFAIKPGEKVIIMEDVVTTGKSSLEVAKVIEENGGQVVALACVVDRRGNGAIDHLPVYSSIKLDIESFATEDCPMCKKSIPYVKPGSRNIK